MRLSPKTAHRRSRNSRLNSAASFALEAMESRVMLTATTLAAWDFDTLPTSTSTATIETNPATTSGTGTAYTVGMQSGNTGGYLYPATGAAATADASTYLLATGSADSGGNGGSEGLTNGMVWRVESGQDSAAPIGSQGVQFNVPTTGDSGIAVSFDMNPSSTGAEAQFAVEYTTDVQDASPVWTNVTQYLAFGPNDTANSVGVTPTIGTSSTNSVYIQNNSSNPNIISGNYATITGPIPSGTNTSWLNDLTVNFSGTGGAGITAVNNTANFAFRVVNAATGTAETAISGAAGPTFKNWRFNDITVTSTAAALAAPVINPSGNPSNQTVPAGNTVTFTSSASGNPAPNVQWYSNTTNSNTGGTLISGATSGNLTFTTSSTAADNGTYYYAVYTNTQGSASTTAAELIDTLATPGNITGPSSVTTTAGNLVTLVSTAATGSPAPTESWQVELNGCSTYSPIISGSGGYTVNGNGSLTFTATSAQNNAKYEAVFTNSQGNATSSPATLMLGGTVITAWNFQNSGNTALVTGQTTLSPAPSTGNGSANSLGMGPTGTYSVYPGTPVGNYTLTISDSSGNYTTGTIAGNATASTIQGDLRALHTATTSGIVVTTNPSASEATGVLLTGDSGATLTGNGTGTGFFVALDNSTLTSSQVIATPDNSNIVAGNDTGSPNGDTAVTNAWRIVGDNGWDSNAPIGTQGAQFLAATTGFSSIEASFDLYATAQGEGKIQVEYTTNGTTWTNVPAADLSIGSGDTGIAVATNSTSGNTTMGGYFNITAPSTNSWYNGLGVNLTGISGVNNNSNFGIRIVNAATLGDCGNITGSPLNNSSGNDRLGDIQITGNNPVTPTITTNPTSQAVAAGSTATFTAAANGYPTPTVQWEVSTNGGTTWTNDTTDTGGNTSTLQVVASTAKSGYEYEAVFTNSVGNATTTAATLSVGPLITTQPSSQTVAAGSTVTLTAAATGNPTPTVQWQINTGSGWGNISGATSATYSFTATEGETGNQYQAVFTNAAATATTSAVTLTVIGTPIAQWNFTNGEGSTAGGSMAPGTGNDPFPTFGPASNTAAPLGLTNDYTGTQAVPECDIIPFRSTVNASFNELIWRMRGGTGAAPTGAPGNPLADGWSQDAPQYDATSIGSTYNGDTVTPQGVVFDVNTAGYSNITFHFDWQQGGISDLQPQYSINGGSTWANVPTANIYGPNGLIESNGGDYYGIGNTTAPTGITLNLQGIAGVGNNTNFELRLVTAYNPSLPLITDGNQLDPTVHGQYGTSGAPGSVNAQQVLQFNNGINDGDTFSLTYGNQTIPVTYSATTATLIAHLDAALTSLVGAGNFSVLPTNYGNVSEDPSTLLQPVRDALGVQNGYGIAYNDLTVTFQGGLAATAVPTLTTTNGNVVIATWVNGSTSGLAPYVDGGGSLEIGNISFNGDSSNTSGLAVTAEPAATSVPGGGIATFTATAYSETTPTVLWQVSTDGGNTWNTATGTTSPTTFTSSASNSYTSTFTYTSHTSLSDNGYKFRAVFTSGSSSANSNSATLTVVTPVSPAITTQPINVSVMEGYTALFTTAATGAPVPTAQWQISTNGGGNWTNLTDTTGNSTVSAVSGSSTGNLSFTSLANGSQNGDEFRVVYTNALSAVPSNVVTLTVLTPETDITNWNFSGATIGNTNSPAPTGGVVDSGTVTPIGMTLPLNPSDPATTGGNGTGSVPVCDIVNSLSALNPSFNENTWRVRGGEAAGGTPNGWSNLVPEYTQGAQFSVPTTGYTNIYVTLDWFCTKSAELDGQEQYTLDGTTWINLGNQIENFSVTPAGNDEFYGMTGNTSTPLPVVFDLTGIAGVANNPNFGVRFVNAYNPTLSNTQVLSLGDTSNFTLSFNGQTTGNITYSSNTTTMASNIQAALGALSNVGSANVAVTSSSGNYSITFQNALNVKAQPAIVPTDTNDSITTNFRYANCQLNGSPLAPVVYNGSKGNWRFDNIEVHGNIIPATPSWATVATGGNASWNSSTQTFTIASGNVTINADPGASSNSPIINAGGNASIVVNTGGNGSTVNLGSLTLTGNATLDVQNNIVLVANTTADPVSTIQGYIAGGQITSSNVTGGSNYAIGYGATTVSGSSYTEFRYDVKGDTNLDGTVNNTDLTTVLQNLGLTTNLWSLGNIEYAASPSSNTTVNNSDLTDVLQNLGISMPVAAVISAGTVSLVQTNATVVDATAIQTTVATVASPLVVTTQPASDPVDALAAAVNAAPAASQASTPVAVAANTPVAVAAAVTPATAVATIADSAIGADELYLGVSYQPVFA